MVLFFCFPKGNGLQALKATCYQQHNACTCCVTKPVGGDARQTLLRELIEWGVQGAKSNEGEHDTLDTRLKRRWGMHV